MTVMDRVDGVDVEHGWDSRDGSESLAACDPHLQAAAAVDRAVREALAEIRACPFVDPGAEDVVREGHEYIGMRYGHEGVGSVVVAVTSTAGPRHRHQVLVRCDGCRRERKLCMGSVDDTPKERTGLCRVCSGKVKGRRGALPGEGLKSSKAEKQQIGGRHGGEERVSEAAGRGRVPRVSE